jgi:hypothetical protein
MLKLVQRDYSVSAHQTIAYRKRLILRRQPDIYFFGHMSADIIARKESALEVVTQIGNARVANEEGLTLAHVAVSAWPIAAELVLKNYRAAMNEPQLDISDWRIRVAHLTTDRKLSVKRHAQRSIALSRLIRQ